ncbi:MAG: 7-cyano-7-deazaguanine synthase QueC [Magnetococcales bacterium]|nr:7-cyano-7-deazaguanine synthase QueC [Magnetococcales bacterium]
MSTKQKALVVLSGGQDSTTCLYWALEKFGKNDTETITFDYGQRHKIEIAAAKKIAQIADVANTVIPINSFAALGGNSLTDSNINVENNLDETTQLPNTFVPGRNLIFLTFAAAFAYKKNIHHLVTGVAQTDYSGYPDCRRDTLQALEKTLELGLESKITLHTPLMFITKKETVLLAKKLGALPAMAHSHTCYNNQHPPCNKCSACQLRAKGFADAGIIDPIFMLETNNG